MKDKKPESARLDELGADARVARMFRRSVIAAGILTLVAIAGLLAWWWLQHEARSPADGTAVAASAALLQPGPEGSEKARGAPYWNDGTGRFTSQTERAEWDIGVHAIDIGTAHCGPASSRHYQEAKAWQLQISA